jgi:hypothetical protein
MFSQIIVSSLSVERLILTSRANLPAWRYQLFASPIAGVPFITEVGIHSRIKVAIIITSGAIQSGVAKLSTVGVRVSLCALQYGSEMRGDVVPSRRLNVLKVLRGDLVALSCCHHG